MAPILGTRRLQWLNEAECHRFAQRLAAHPALRTACVELWGPLGAGKTTLTRAVLKALGVQGKIKSPTYAVLETYSVPGCEISHFDFFRFSDPHEFEDAGFREVFSRAGLKMVEWPQKAAGQLPTPDLRLHIEPMTEDRREVQVEALTPQGLALMATMDEAHVA
ncbi:MAG: ATPase [Pseudomonadota bacterium]|jgi:tRNA threonylcarbamoyladenosine biosynthesis protein TsaE